MCVVCDETERESCVCGVRECVCVCVEMRRECVCVVLNV